MDLNGLKELNRMGKTWFVLYKFYEADNLEDFDVCLAHGMLVFAYAKTSELTDNILSYFDNNKTFVDIFSYNCNPEIKKNYQIIAIYPTQLPRDEFDKRENFLIDAIQNSTSQAIYIEKHHTKEDLGVFKIEDKHIIKIGNCFDIEELLRVVLIGLKLEIFIKDIEYGTGIFIPAYKISIAKSYNDENEDSEQN